MRNAVAPADDSTPIGAATSSFSAPNDHDTATSAIETIGGADRGGGRHDAERDERDRAQAAAERSHTGAEHARPDPGDRLDQDEGEPDAGEAARSRCCGGGRAGGVDVLAERASAGDLRTSEMITTEDREAVDGVQTEDDRPQRRSGSPGVVPVSAPARMNSRIWTATSRIGSAVSSTVRTPARESAANSTASSDERGQHHLSVDRVERRTGARLRPVGRRPPSRRSRTG